MLEARYKTSRSSPTKISRRDNGSAPTDQATAIESSDRSVGTLEKFFNAAMDRYLAEEREANEDPATTRPQHQESQDVEMESIRSSDSGSRWELSHLCQATVVTAATGSTGSTMVQHVRISPISDLKEFTGKDQDEDRARAWIGKAKSAFMRDQASDNENCLTFADLPPWIHQELVSPSRSTRNKWSDLLRSFQIQYCGLGVSVTRQYYHTRHRSDQSPLDYLYCLNVAGLRARLKIKDGSVKDRREHVDHYIETLEDQDLAERGPSRSGSRQESSEEGCVRQKTTNTAPSAPVKQVRAIQIQASGSGTDSESDGSSGSDSDIDSHRRISLAANEDVTPKVEKESTNLDPRLRDRDHGHQRLQLENPR
ncbi:LOW QUALITY PROTEIN: hypothetical protein PHMEG_00028374 [Phytophthora megakarya]|uniref:Eukaryotic/viral aspartic protease n=1 Tax=Phytophthora megakarya TaxID=4795 RepID=A0A225V5Q3_9STRA|nr:LOW QUALITY PROTEIN: hypothetical protein PHMEG_00028374 [Phytophthora megakarya]